MKQLNWQPISSELEARSSYGVNQNSSTAETRIYNQSGNQAIVSKKGELKTKSKQSSLYVIPSAPE